MGYTPNLVVGVWVGNADNQPMVDVTGISGAGPIWNQFIRRVLLGQPELDFTRPDGLIDVDVCALSGKLPTEACQRTYREIFIPGTEPTEEDDFYQIFEIDRRTGTLADENTPPEYRTAQVFIVLPQEARDWGMRHGIRQPPAGALIQAPDDDRSVRLLEPDPYTVFEVSPITPIETQRLRFTVGVPSSTQSVRYYLNDQLLSTVTQSPWDYWWSLAVGEYELVAEATLADGAVQRSAPIPFRVVPYGEIGGAVQLGQP
ncbi:MAG: hypothetical protein D6712_06405 [Chloroflexi bacterium]|nr:MAG: hypothetical protein D6712_06405 [Chloroflexota bacterium]